MRILRVSRLGYYVLLFIFLFARSLAHGSATGLELSATGLELKGIASGGDLYLSDPLNREPLFVKINTNQGESAKSVSERLLGVLKLNQPNRNVVLRGNEIQGLPGDGEFKRFILGGSETGLGIPPPPVSLSGRYDKEAGTVRLNWENPSEPYDHILVMRTAWGGPRLSGEATSTTFEIVQPRKRVYPADLGITVFGVRDGIPSNAASIDLFDPCAQEEMHALPFTGGVMSNWTTFGLPGETVKGAFSQGRKTVEQIKENATFPEVPSEKTRFQIIRSSSNNSFGLLRRFINLEPGHKYRFHVRVKIIDEQTSPNWRFRIFLSHNGTDDKLTLDQLLGKADLPLPRGVGRGGQLLELNYQNSAPDWILRTSGDTTANNKVGDLELPSTAKSLSVWARFEGDQGVSACIDWIKLEDLTCRELTPSDSSQAQPTPPHTMAR